MEYFFYLCTKLNINLLTMTSVSKDAIFGYFWIFSLSLIIHQFHIFFINFVIINFSQCIDLDITLLTSAFEASRGVVAYLGAHANLGNKLSALDVIIIIIAIVVLNMNTIISIIIIIVIIIIEHYWTRTLNSSSRKCGLQWAQATTSWSRFLDCIIHTIKQSTNPVGWMASTSLSYQLSSSL